VLLFMKVCIRPIWKTAMKTSWII